jgi:hypothetical protein
MPLSTFQLNRGGQFYWWGNRIARENTTDLAQVIDKLYQILVVIGTDCIGSCKSYYHTTTNNYNTQTIFLLKSNPKKKIVI